MTNENKVITDMRAYLRRVYQFKSNTRVVLNSSAKTEFRHYNKVHDEYATVLIRPTKTGKYTVTIIDRQYNYATSKGIYDSYVPALTIAIAASDVLLKR